MDKLEVQVAHYVWHLNNQGKVSKNTVTAYDSDLRLFSSYLKTREPAIGSWNEVRPATLHEYVTHMRDRQALKPSTVARRVVAIRSFFQYLKEQGVVEEDPCDELRHPGPPISPPRVLSEEEVQQLLHQTTLNSSPKGLRDRAMLEVLLATGMRVSQLTALKMGDVDIASGTLRLLDGQEERILLMSAQAIQALRDYLERGRIQFLRDLSTAALFVNYNGRRLSRQGVWLIIKQYVKKANIPGNVTTRTLRHSFAHHQLAEGVSIDELQNLLGHTSPAATRAYLRTNRVDDDDET
ncbi:MAG: tyrosine-type recombinase/integrase [Chloroflexi bacterium]|nr:tyrosine-type recombinase/integrase [Chloroflexota bacterium]